MALPPPAPAADRYRIGPGDILALSLPGSVLRVEVQASGCIELPAATAVRVEGLTPAQSAHVLAEALGLSPQEIGVSVVEYRSRMIYVSGEVAGHARAVPYQGPETVLDFLRRLGGLTPESAPERVQVIRYPAEGTGPPEVYRVDLRAILLHDDQRSNIVLQPYDRVYVPETRQSVVERCLPPWLVPVWRVITFGF